MKRKEMRASLRQLPNGEKIMQITKAVSKTVKGPDGKDFKRKANLTLDVPEDLSNLPALIASFGSVEKLASAAYFGVISKAKQDATNELMKGDKTSKALKKMVAGLKAVMTSLSDEAATQMILATPGMADAFKSEPMTPEINMSVNPASKDFEFPALKSDDAEGSAESEDEEDETEESTDDKTATA